MTILYQTHTIPYYIDKLQATGLAHRVPSVILNSVLLPNHWAAVPAGRPGVGGMTLYLTTTLYMYPVIFCQTAESHLLQYDSNSDLVGYTTLYWRVLTQGADCHDEWVGISNLRGTRLTEW